MTRTVKYFLFLLLAAQPVLGQHPDQYPPPVPEAVNFDLFNLILYILLPLALIIAYFLYQNSQKKKRQQKKTIQKQQEQSIKTGDNKDNSATNDD